MLRFMLDTDTCIYTIKRKPGSVRRTFNQHDGQMCVSAITQMELVYGAEKSANPSRNARVIEGFLARLDVLDFDSNAAAHSGEIRAALSRQGMLIGPYDQMIAGHARSRGLVVVTNNEREFSRVPGIRIVNWTT